MLTLLLADDSVTTQRVIALTFAEESFRVVTASDGQQALDAMTGQPPDIVLASTVLPRISGYDLAQQMQGRAALRSVPVLLLSGAFESVDAARLEASGARGFIEKPLEPTAVVSRVRELLGLKDTSPAVRLAPVAPQAPLALSCVADDFAALLAFETGDVVEPPPVPSSAAASVPIVVQAGAPEITDVILDQIAQRVADRLNSSNFGADFRTAMTAAIRDTVRTVVADTSERLVRDEIGRVKARAERDTQ